MKFIIVIQQYRFNKNVFDRPFLHYTWDRFALETVRGPFKIFYVDEFFVVSLFIH